MELLDELGTRVLCGDGAMGTLLMADGVSLERCFEELCVTDPERIQKIHEQYIGAGARVIETNTFGANAVRLERFGMEERVVEINCAAVRVARNAAKGRDVYIAGSVGPLGLSADAAAARGIDRARCFSEQMGALLDAGVDVIFFETFTDLAEMEIAFRAKKELTDLPGICSFACASNGRLSCGMGLGHAVVDLRAQGVEMVGVNCMNGPGETARLLAGLPPGFVLAASPAAGHLSDQNGQPIDDATPRDFARAADEMVARGARLIGGCCGTNPTHIAAIAAAIGGLPMDRAKRRE